VQTPIPGRPAAAARSQRPDRRCCPHSAQLRVRLNSVALGLYLSEVGLDGSQIGLVLSAALAGSLGLTLVIALYGDRIGRRRLLIAGSLLMATAALIPFVSSDPLLLALIALSGMVAVNANESTGLQTVDQAVLPASVANEQRTAAFALYNLLASSAAALGALSVSLLPQIGAGLGLTAPRSTRRHSPSTP